ncbi:hypothetical protein KA005_50715 [bacterium]|nr:hypothetical protein [bacterium]
MECQEIKVHEKNKAKWVRLIYIQNCGEFFEVINGHMRQKVYNQDEALDRLEEIICNILEEKVYMEHPTGRMVEMHKYILN